MSLTLYGLGRSRSFRVLWALEEVGAEFEYLDLDMGSTADDGNLSSSYLKLNPQGKVPTLIDDEFVLTESNAIVNYVATFDGGEGFVPPDRTRERAEYDELCFFIQSDFEQPLWTSGKHRFALPEEHRVPEILPTAIWEFEKSQSALKEMIDLNHFAIGDHFTFADVLLAHTISWADSFKFPVDQQLLSYRDRQFERPAVAAAIARLPK